MGVCNSKNNKHHHDENHSKSNRVKVEKEIIINSNLYVNKAEGLPSENYSIIKKLGEGSSGVVWKVKHLPTNYERAMKKLIKNPKTKELEKEILNEFEILRKLDHPNIVKIFEFYNTSEGYFLINEFCKHGELYEKIVQKAPFSEKVSAHIMFQIFSAVNYCHSSNIIHRNLKPENILIDSTEADRYYNIKIIDFGTAKIYDKNKSERRLIGSSFYIAPEVLQKNYNEKCDLWSCGVIMYTLLSGKLPFNGERDAIIFQKIKLGKYDLERIQFNSTSPEAKDLITKLLEIDPKKRINAANAINHPWFNKLDTRRIFSESNEKLIRSALNNIKNYNPEHKLQLVVLAYLVHNFPQIEEVHELKKIFSKFDENLDGKLTKDEMTKVISNFLQENMQEVQKKVNEIFEKIDNDNNGYIEFEEFIRAGIDKEIFLDEDILRFAFNFFDKDCSGEITIDELKVAFCVDNDVILTERLLKKLMAGIDIDKNGEISFNEFQTMMKKILRPQN